MIHVYAPGLTVEVFDKAVDPPPSPPPAPEPPPSPPAPEPPPAPPSTSSIVQYLTSDGGTEPYSGNFSGPTRDKWHNRLGFAWKRKNGLGNWLDATQVAEGTNAFASTGAAASVGQVLNVDITALVQRWVNTGGHNRGFYLSTRGSAWPVTFHGRGHAQPENRPTLTVVTTSGTVTLRAAANACWANSTFTGVPSKDSFTVASGSQVAIVRFDLSGVTDAVSATLSLTVAAFRDGRTGQIVDIFEADPPTIIAPENVASPAQGLLVGYADFNAFKNSGVALFADDFEVPGSFDTGFTPPATRTLNTATGTIYARGTIASGANGSADANKTVSQGTGPRGTPNVVHEELFGHYAWFMEDDFGTTQDDAIKIPAMGMQFGQWNPVGYWQQTTGNGGSPGTGLKIDNGGTTHYEYQGHSVRFLTGTAPRAGDDDPYAGWFPVSIYPYNLDQGGPFPPGETFPMVALRKGQWYEFDIRVKQNTMTGAQDALGNYETANPDGIYQVWINGLNVYSRTDYRWRRHAEFGVQGLWVDVYHGGQSPALVDMHYRVDRVAIATKFIGPAGSAAVPAPPPAPLPPPPAPEPHPPATLPSYVPAPGEVAVLTVANGGLTNNFRSQTASNFAAFYTSKVINDYSGGVVNPYYGTYGATLYDGGGHSATNDNSLFALEFGQTAATWRRLTNPTAFAPGSDISPGVAYDAWGEYTLDGQPMSRHTYADANIIGPADGGAMHGTFIRVLSVAAGYVGVNPGETPHKVDVSALTGAMAWQRAGTKRGTFGSGAPCYSAYVPAQNRVYFELNASARPVAWFNVGSGTYVDGKGTGRTQDGENRSGGMLLHVPERSLLLFFDSVAGNLGVRYMDVSVSQPSWNNTRRTLSASIPVPLSSGQLTWSQACWCPDNERLIIGNVSGDANCVYEIAIPATLSDTWTCTRVPFASGQVISWAQETGYKAWDYNTKTKTINYFAYADLDGSEGDVVYVYRPRNT